MTLLHHSSVFSRLARPARVRPVRAPRFEILQDLESRVLLSATHLVVGLQPVNGYVGSPNAFALEIEVQDAAGNVVTTDTSTIKVAVQTGPGKVTGITTLHATAGIASFNHLLFAKAGTYTLIATDTGLAPALTTPIVISPAPAAAALAFVQQPVGNPVGATITTPITVNVLDQYGNIFTKPTEVSLKILTGPAKTQLTGKLTVKSVGGLATFSNVTLSKGGTFLLVARMGKAFTVSSAFSMGGPPTSTSLAFLQQPSTVGAGFNMVPPVTVQVKDQYGNLMVKDKSTIKIVAAGPANKAFTAVVKQGTAVFSKLNLTVAGLYQLIAVDKGLTLAFSDAFTVVAGPANHLAFASILLNGALHLNPADITVKVLDKFNNVVLTDASTVTLNFAAAPAGVAPLGLTATASAGVATFSAVTFPVAGKYTLRATDGLLASALSSPFVLL